MRHTPQEVFSFEESALGADAPLLGAAALAARFARRPGHEALDDDDDTALDALDIEEIAALGLSSDDILEDEEDEGMTFEDEAALRAALGDAAFGRLRSVQPRGGKK